jgi:hypothetical protein
MKVTLHFDLKDPEATVWLERLTVGLTNKQPSSQGFFGRMLRAGYSGLAGFVKQAFNQVTVSDRIDTADQEKAPEQSQSTKTQSGENTPQP